MLSYLRGVKEQHLKISFTCQLERISHRTQTRTDSGNRLRWHDIHMRAAMFVKKIVYTQEDASLGQTKPSISGSQ